MPHRGSLPMARYLFTVWQFSGHLHPSLAIAGALRSRGHEVAFYSAASARPTIETEGFRCFPFVKVNEERINELISAHSALSNHKASFLESARALKRFGANLREWMLETIPGQVIDIEAAMEQWRPDVLMCDQAFAAPFLVLREKLGIPVAVLSVTAACILPGPDAPLPGRPRHKNWIMRRSSAFQRKLVDWFGRRFRTRANELRAAYGLAPMNCSVTEFAGRMPLYLVPSAPEYDYERRDLPPSVHYVGPCLWDKPSSEPPPGWLDQLPADRPLIYVTEATVGTSEPFLLTAAAIALRDLPVQVVMTTGKQRNPSELDSVRAPNVRVEAYVPQSDLLPKAAVMITIGGSGGVLAALKEGVPLVVVPTEWDRPENAQRVAEAGAGLRIDPKQCTPERLRSAVNRVLTEGSFRKNALRLADAFARYGGPIQAAELLEALALPTATAPPHAYAGSGRAH